MVLSSSGADADVMYGVVTCCVVDVCAGQADAWGAPGAMAVYGGSSPPCK